jgi:hypothetical protein
LGEVNIHFTCARHPQQGDRRFKVPRRRRR